MSPLRGTAMYTTRVGSTLAITGVTLKRVGIVARKCPTCGLVGVYVGTTLIGKVDLHSTTSVRAVISLSAFTLRTGTVKLKVLSSGKPGLHRRARREPRLTLEHLAGQQLRGAASTARRSRRSVSKTAWMRHTTSRSTSARRG